MEASFLDRAARAAALALAFASAQPGAAVAEGRIWHASFANAEYGRPETDDWLVRLNCANGGAIRVVAGPGDAPTGETILSRRSPFVQNLRRGFTTHVVVNARRFTLPGVGAPAVVGRLLAECPARR